VTIRLAATGGYHINKEYPYKFVATPTASVQFLGSGDANTFSRAAGDFREEGETTATMTVRLKPSSAGEMRFSGTYKMSVCSASNCQIEQQAVALTVSVM
jgi:acyl-coenzyme A thioesterase PaaI-like protein